MYDKSRWVDIPEEVVNTDIGKGTISNAGVILLRKDGSALMQHRDDNPLIRRAGMWVPPGGSIEDGESPEEGARREFLEETLYICGDLHYLGTFEEHLEGDWPAFLVAIFWGIYDGVQSVKCMEGQAIEFIPRGLVTEYGITLDVVDLWDKAISNAANYLKV